jgi:predicted nuclease of predicted toxin-antitoxin system
MKFLIDRCAGVRLAQWLRERGHDVVESRERGADPGDRALLQLAADEQRILVTIDTDFGQLVFAEDLPQPDAPAERRTLRSSPTCSRAMHVTWRSAPS